MADKIIDWAELVAGKYPIKLIDNGDGSYSLSTTGAGNVTLPVTVPNGGTGATTLTGIVKGNGAAAMTALAIPLTVSNGGTGATTLTGILKGNGTAAATAITIPADATKYLDGTGAFSTPPGGGVNSQIFDGNLSIMADGLNHFVSIFSDGSSGSVENRKQGVIAQALTASLLTVALDAAPGVGHTVTVTLRKNGADTALTVVIVDNATTGTDNTHTVAFAVGDLINMNAVQDALGSTTRVMFGGVLTF